MNLRGIDLNLLVVLDALLAEAHVSRAAERLGLSQPATSAALERCRHLFGDRLLERSAGGMRLTARAEALREPLAAALAAVAATLQAEPPPLAELTAAVRELAASIRAHGVFNFMLSNGDVLFTHCSTHLHYLVRQAPFSVAHLVDNDVSIDFAEVTTPSDRVAVIATQPLTDNETWTAHPKDTVLVFRDGAPLMG